MEHRWWMTKYGPKTFPGRLVSTVPGLMSTGRGLPNRMLVKVREIERQSKVPFVVGGRLKYGNCRPFCRVRYA